MTDIYEQMNALNNSLGIAKGVGDDRTNSAIKKIINFIFRKELFSLVGMRSKSSIIREDYKVLFGIGNDRGQRVLEDLADYCGFFKSNIGCNKEIEGRRQAFIYLLSKITKEG